MPDEAKVFVVMIDIKDGFFDAIHAFTTAAVAEEYCAWQQGYSGDTCYVNEMPLETTWAQPAPGPGL